MQGQWCSRGLTASSKICFDVPHGDFQHFMAAGAKVARLARLVRGCTLRRFAPVCGKKVDNNQKGRNFSYNRRLRKTNKKKQKNTHKYSKYIYNIYYRIELPCPSTRRQPGLTPLLQEIEEVFFHLGHCALPVDCPGSAGYREPQGHGMPQGEPVLLAVGHLFFCLTKCLNNYCSYYHLIH